MTNRDKELSKLVMALLQHALLELWSAESAFSKMEDTQVSGLGGRVRNTIMLLEDIVKELQDPKEVKQTPMTEHDRIQRDRALTCDRNDLESLSTAIAGLQSTDHPSLAPLYKELLECSSNLLAKREILLAKKEAEGPSVQNYSYLEGE